MHMQLKMKVTNPCQLTVLLLVCFPGVIYQLCTSGWNTFGPTASNLQSSSSCRQSPSDPLVYNELGVVAYHMMEYKKAVWWFEKTLAHVPTSLSEMWEPTVVNLAHALRKLKKYSDATAYYEKALALSTRSLSTYAGLAYSYHLQDNYTTAISYYHKALWLKPDDQFCTEMLTLALVDESRCGAYPKMESHQDEHLI